MEAREMEAVALEEILHDGGRIIEAIRIAGLDLAHPIDIVENNVQERNIIPKNSNYYEETIPLYVGDLFIEHFRMSRECFEELLIVVGNGIVHEQTIPLEKKLMFTIWVLAKPETFLAAGDRFGLARSTAHRSFKEIINILAQLMNQYIVWPNNHNEAVQTFLERSRGFPGVIGAVDGCHIPIKQPSNNANDYYNRKQVHSIILQGICNHKGILIDINVGMPGRVHDARVFRNSPIYTELINEVDPLLPQEYHILGDSAYPIMKNLLTPFRDNGHLNEDQVRYNVKLSALRSIIERAFGRLKGKFRRLKYLDIAEPEFGTYIITAACVLHNFILIHGDEELQEDEEGIDDEQINIAADNVRPEDNRQIGTQKRLNIVNLLRQN